MEAISRAADTVDGEYYRHEAESGTIFATLMRLKQPGKALIDLRPFSHPLNH